MKQSKLVVLMSALLCGAAAGTASATVITADQPVAIILPASALGLVLAKHGADDVLPEPCDDHGTDLCVSGGQAIAKHGADDVLPEPCDDHGTDLCVSGGQTIAKHGADDVLPEPCDDHGTDLCLMKA